MSALLEVCVDGMESALAAQAGGADRLELCASLSAEGTTPSHGLIAQCQSQLSIPLMVMIRPHDGDFSYSEDDLQVMLRDIRIAKSLGVQGIVTGVLRDGYVDRAACARLREAAAPLEATFHRAFDVVEDPMSSLEEIIDLGFDRILTSGQQATVEEGLDLLRALQRSAGDRITMLAGSGVRPENVSRIVVESGVREVHASASIPVDAPGPSTVTFGANRRITCAETVRAIKQALG